MERGRVEKALARIEAAAARIEAAAQRPQAAGDPDLPRKHAELKASVGQTLRDLDALIGQLER